MTVLVGIPTFERESLVRHCFATVAELDLPPGSEIRIFDDASPSLDAGRLIAEAALVAGLQRNPQRLGPSETSFVIWRYFLAGNHRHLLILDSDMIANRSAVAHGLQLREGFDGLLSLYNSINHQGTPDGPDRLRKRRLGNAGTLWTRELADLVLRTFAESMRSVVDDRYSALFNDRGVPMITPAQSRLQHLGIVGTNNIHYGTMEHGLGFVADSEAQLRAIAALYDDLMTHQDRYVPPLPRLHAYLAIRGGRLRDKLLRRGRYGR